MAAITRLGLYGGSRPLYGSFSGKAAFVGVALPGLFALGALDPTSQSAKGALGATGASLLGALSSGEFATGIIDATGQSAKGVLDSTGLSGTGAI